MRLDKMLSECGISRSDTAKACRSGCVSVNGIAVSKPDFKVDPDSDAVVFRGNPIRYRKFVYIMLNKPDGYVSATEDAKEKVVTELLPAEYQRLNLFPCGRLDKHTLGLMLLTNDGDLAHRLLAPKSHVTKSYGFTVESELNGSDIALLEAGVDIGEEKLTRPCTVRMQDGTHGVITLTEGKYHQIKRMMEAVGNKITALERLTFGCLSLDTSLDRGEWRELTEQEVAGLQNRVEK